MKVCEFWQVPFLYLPREPSGFFFDSLILLILYMLHHVDWIPYVSQTWISEVKSTWSWCLIFLYGGLLVRIIMSIVIKGISCLKHTKEETCKFLFSACLCMEACWHAGHCRGSDSTFWCQEIESSREVWFKSLKNWSARDDKEALRAQMNSLPWGVSCYGHKKRADAQSVLSSFSYGTDVWRM